MAEARRNLLYHNVLHYSKRCLLHITAIGTGHHFYYSVVNDMIAVAVIVFREFCIKIEGHPPSRRR